MKNLFTILILCLASCSTPFVGRATFDGTGALAFDGDLFTLAAEGTGKASVSVKGSQTPLYAFAWQDAIIYASSQQGEWSERYAPGDELSAKALQAFAANFSAAQMAVLNTILQGAPGPVP